jgi:formamidopyrimidine-DNA glycosylase
MPKDLAKTLRGRSILMIARRAKYILIGLSDHLTLIAHLGMTGGFAERPSAKVEDLQKHDHLVLTLDNGRVVAFFDPRRFGQIDLNLTAHLAHHRSLKDLGPEPLERSFTGRVLHERLAGKRTAIKIALLDQCVVAGVGNIYASEALFYAGVHPARQAGTLTLSDCVTLVQAIKKVLRRSIAAGGSTLKDYRQVNGELGFFQDRFAVYDRGGQPCPGCQCSPKKTGGIARTVQGGRATYFCPTRQPI